MGTTHLLLSIVIALQVFGFFLRPILDDRYRRNKFRRPNKGYSRYDYSRALCRLTKDDMKSFKNQIFPESENK